MKVNSKLKHDLLKWFVFIIFAIYAITLIFPFAWMLVNSFKENNEFFRNI